VRTTSIPRGHTELAFAYAGTPYGHVPGHHYHDVDVSISRRGNAYRVHVCETWGDAQGYDREAGRLEAFGYGTSVEQAVDCAERKGITIGIDCQLAARALALAADKAIQE